MSRILVLGTGAPQADLIKECKSRSMDVYACSYNVGDPGEKYADGFEHINIVDAGAVEDYAKRIKADLVYSAGSDVAMPVALSVAEHIGLRAFCSSEIAEICNKKPLLRKFLGADFEGNLHFQCVSSVNEELKIPFPLMMKPSDSQGQRGVCLVRSGDEYRKQFEKSMSFSSEGKVILEEYVEGKEISVNTFSQNGSLIFCLPSDRIIWSEYPGGIIHRHILPSVFSDSTGILNKIYDLVDRTLKKLNILDGPAYFQIMIDKSGAPKLIEVTPRLDGCHMWRLIKYSTGVDLLSLSVDALTGSACGEIKNYSVIPYETEFLCLPPAAKFSKQCFSAGGNEYLEWYYDEGETVKRINGYMEKCGYTIKRYNH